MQYKSAEKFITELLQSKLSPLLFYHDYFHTMDVLKACIAIANEEHITDENELTLLKTAALFHDCGFVNAYHQHEEEGCRIAREQLPSFGYTNEQIEKICMLIMATKTPQDPKTLLEKILCDADLSYLGTNEFERQGKKLYKEWKERGKLQTEKEWNELQIKFLQSHHYWTASAVLRLKKKKEEHLKKLIASDQ